MIEFSSITFITSLKTFTKHRVAILKFSDCTVIIPLCKVIIGRYYAILKQSEHAYLHNQPSNIMLMYEYLDKISNSPNYSHKQKWKLSFEKKIQVCTGAGPLTFVIPVQCSTNRGNINQLANKPTHVYFFCVYYIHVMVTVQLSVL